MLPHHNMLFLIILIVLIFLWLLTSKKFWKKVDRKCREDELVGEEEAPQ